MFLMKSDVIYLAYSKSFGRDSKPKRKWSDFSAVRGVSKAHAAENIRKLYF